MSVLTILIIQTKHDSIDFQNVKASTLQKIPEHADRITAHQTSSDKTTVEMLNHSNCSLCSDVSAKGWGVMVGEGRSKEHSFMLVRHSLSVIAGPFMVNAILYTTTFTSHWKRAWCHHSETLPLLCACRWHWIPTPVYSVCVREWESECRTLWVWMGQWVNM